MQDDKRSFLTRKQASKSLILATAGASACAVVLSITFFAAAAVSTEIPPAVQKKTVSLSHSRVFAENFFIGNCGKCHKLPDPADPTTPKADCTSGIPELGVGMVQVYLADVRAGKKLYESHCGRCHTLLDPGSQTADYWSKNLCTSDECFVKKLHDDEEQQLLLYLSSHAKKN